ncbi:MAG: heavy-metal-associated domain-containing protein [Spirochaetia bacterium]|nr:heavy-metal-associated domain-containing protein [Spirochaetia bacterium]
MTTTIKTTGMMCSKCEARVTKALLGMNGITSCKADAKTGNVVVEAKDPQTVEDAKKLIYDIGYEVV